MGSFLESRSDWNTSICALCQWYCTSVERRSVRALAIGYSTICRMFAPASRPETKDLCSNCYLPCSSKHQRKDKLNNSNYITSYRFKKIASKLHLGLNLCFMIERFECEKRQFESHKIFSQRTALPQTRNNCVFSIPFHSCFCFEESLLLILFYCESNHSENMK